MPYLLAIDQGTTSSRALVFDAQALLVSQHQIEFQQYFPQSGWVEHDAEEIWQTTLVCCQKAIDKAGLRLRDIVAIGITNQRETTVLWDKATGNPIYKAIVWQDRRTSDLCQALKTEGYENLIYRKTGLLLDPYFSATKIVWLLDHVPGARRKAEQGALAFGTIDSFLLWRLTKGQSHFTDITNACRTLLFNIHSQQWDKELLNLFKIPETLLPQVLDNVSDFGSTNEEVLGAIIPVAAMAGDQQAALVGQTCFQPGMVKSTYGTGAFLMLNTGSEPVASKNRLLTTIAYRIRGNTNYALEGSIFSAGSIIKWLRDKLGLIKHASETAALAASLSNNDGVYLVPAFTGLGAPYWEPNARAAIQGLNRDTQAAHIVRAGLEAVAYQTLDLVEAMRADSGQAISEIRMDGGMTVNNWLMQFLADMLATPVTRPTIVETTALGIAYLAGLGVGWYTSLDEISQLWQPECQFVPHMLKEERESLQQGWRKAVDRVIG